MKTSILLLMILGVALMFCSYGIGVERGKNSQTVVVNLEMNEDLFNAARSYHGNIVIMYDETESFYFMRDGERCSVFSKSFEKWNAKRLMEEK